MPLDAVELTGYYFAETDAEYLAPLKGRCTRHGLDVSGTAIGNDFCLPIRTSTRNRSTTKKWVEHTSRLGGKTIRIFAGNVEKGDAEDKARGPLRRGDSGGCDYAGKYGIYLALENHGGITVTLDQILAVVKAVRARLVRRQPRHRQLSHPRPLRRPGETGPLCGGSAGQDGGLPKGKKEAADLKRVVEILTVDFRGYAALEYEGDVDARQAVPRHIGELRKIVG